MTLRRRKNSLVDTCSQAFAGNVTVDDVKSCIMTGEIIEEYPNDFPQPSALIFGYDLNRRVIHVVCGMDEKILYAVAAYVPTTEKFMEDLRTRRQK